MALGREAKISSYAEGVGSELVFRNLRSFAVFAGGWDALGIDFFTASERSERGGMGGGASIEVSPLRGSEHGPSISQR